MFYYIYIYIYTMNSSIKDYHRKQTYDELIQEASIHPTDMIKYPNRIATQLRTSAQLSRFEDENFLDTHILNSNAMKQTIQQTALHKATQPVARYIKTGLEQFDIFDTDDTIQQQADDNTADLEELQLRKKKKENHILDSFINDLWSPTQVDTIIQGNLRGTSSSVSTPPPEDSKATSSKSKSKGNLRGSSSSDVSILEEDEDEDEFNYKPREIVTDITLVEETTQHLKQLGIEINHNI